MPVTAEQTALAQAIETKMRQLLGAGLGDIEIIVEMRGETRAFNRLIIDADDGQDALIELCQKFHSFHRYAKILIDLGGVLKANQPADAANRRFCVPAVRHSEPGIRKMTMTADKDRIDNAVLALLYLGRHDTCRAWKGFDWGAMNRLYEKGFIGDPVGKAKSVVFTEEGLLRSEQLFRTMFTIEAG
jgi:Domain of unknown function (DUF6429)